VPCFGVCELCKRKPAELVRCEDQPCATTSNRNRCCPANYVCASPANSNGLIGCCPSGNTCGGPAAPVTTVTVYPQQQTAIVYANPAPHTTVAYNNPPPNQAQGGFCATITMDGPGLPKTAQGECGTILLVSGAPGLKVLGIGATIVAIMLQLAFGRMFNRS